VLGSPLLSERASRLLPVSQAKNLEKNKFFTLGYYNGKPSGNNSRFKTAVECIAINASILHFCNIALLANPFSISLGLCPV